VQKLTELTDFGFLLILSFLFGNLQREALIEAPSARVSALRANKKN